MSSHLPASIIRRETLSRRAKEVEKMTEERRTTTEEAKRVGDEIGVDWSRFELEQFRAGMDVEFEHGAHDPQTDVTHDDPIITGKIALAHMKEFPDYYERLEKMEREAEREWAEKS
jgi:tetrahydromethanopterin S-methyltransferase subunit G